MARPGQAFLPLALLFPALLVGPRPALAQGGAHDHMAHAAPGAGWQLSQHGLLFGLAHTQSGPRGGSEFVAPNWWMGMAGRSGARGQLTFTGMFSLDAAAVGKSGYRELFQVGEALDGEPLVDRQHPHDFFMQLSGSWRVPVGGGGFTLAGGPVADPALGPGPFMHRASAWDNPTAPLSHHTFDSTHIAFGVVTAAIDRGAWTAEGSVFNGREPDEDRWGFDFGPLDSYSGRLWYRPMPALAFQVSAGRLRDPEELEPGDITRTTVSGSWTRAAAAGTASITAGFGRNDTEHGVRSAMFVEAARDGRPLGGYGRFEVVQTELADDAVVAMTAGIVRDLIARTEYEAGLGADVTYHIAPEALRAAYGEHPYGARLFFRVRLK